MNMKATLLLVIGLALVCAAPGGKKGKRSPQLPPLPPMPPGVPMPPGMLDLAMETITRFSRQAPEDVPKTRLARQADNVPKEQPSRFVRQSPDDAPKEPPARVARQAVNNEMDKPQHIRQEAFYSSITAMSRKKRGSSVNRAESEIRG